MRIRNFTPHDIRVRTLTGEFLTFPSEGNARVVTPLAVELVGSVPIYTAKTPSLVGLPPFEKGTLVIVSITVFFNSDREDLGTVSYINHAEDGSMYCRGLSCRKEYLHVLKESL
nr:hypothetical protein [uncultured bacterium]